MQDKNKLWFVNYLDVRGLNDDQISKMANLVAKVNRYDESVNIMIIPQRDHKTTVEVLYDPTSKNNEIKEETTSSRIFSEALLR